MKQIDDEYIAKRSEMSEKPACGAIESKATVAATILVMQHNLFSGVSQRDTNQSGFSNLLVMLAAIHW